MNELYLHTVLFKIIGHVDNSSPLPTCRDLFAASNSSGAVGEENQAIGKSVGGNTTKIHMAVDACSFPVEFELTGGEVYDAKAAPNLIEKLPKSDYAIAEKFMIVRKFEN
ncbi:hypothetical protein FOLKNPGA_02726 [Legionella sp. PC1000]|nr:hypothetical protein FOLKNPGA_02726 [Legionella sp. PC1000]